MLSGVNVVELPSGIAGAMSAMLLADHGADVVKVELPEGRPPGGAASTFPWSSRAVWDRGKRSVVVDPDDPDAVAAIERLIQSADIVIGGDSNAPYGGAFAGGLADRLIRCCISPYGRGSGEPAQSGYDPLVAARMGLQWDQRGYDGGAPAFIAGVDPLVRATETPEGVDQMGRAVDTPVYLALPWPSIGACLLALAGISAALLARERTGRGQVVETSLVQGGLLTAIPTWQRVPDPLVAGFRLAYFDRRHPKGLFRCADGLWLHQWAPFEHAFVQAAASGPTLRMPDDLPATRRRSTGDYEADIAYEHEQYLLTAAAFARFDRQSWVDLFAAANKAAQPVRSAEDGLADEVSLEHGPVKVVGEDGRSHQVGPVYRLSSCPASVGAGAPEPGQHTAEILAAARGPVTPGSGRLGGFAGGGPVADPRGALDGVTVLDLGVAMAGPFGAQILGDLGAEVIKVHNIAERHGPVTSPILGCQRGKRSIALDLKQPEAQEILHDLVRQADVVHHNLRIGVAERLGAGYDLLSQINPRLIYCHTRGFEAAGPRATLPGNDQMGQALAGTWYEMGAVHAGGAPIWHPSALGDFGNGVASAVAVIQALYHRERTGRGQFVDTSILDLGYLYNSYTHLPTSGPAPERPRLTADLLGMSALCRLYRCRTGWICLAAPEDGHWDGLRTATGLAELDEAAFETREGRADRDGRLAEILSAAFTTDSAEEWAGRLQAAGVPAEVVDREFPRKVFDDPCFVDREWVVGRPHPLYGRVEQAGRLVELSETRGVIRGAAPLVGEHSSEILRQLGRSEETISDLLERGVVAEAVAPVGEVRSAGG